MLLILRPPLRQQCLSQLSISTLDNKNFLIITNPIFPLPHVHIRTVISFLFNFFLLFLAFLLIFLIICILAFFLHQDNRFWLIFQISELLVGEMVEILAGFIFAFAI